MSALRVQLYLKVLRKPLKLLHGVYILVHFQAVCVSPDRAVSERKKMTSWQFDSSYKLQVKTSAMWSSSQDVLVIPEVNNELSFPKLTATQYLY